MSCSLLKNQETIHNVIRFCRWGIQWFQIRQFFIPNRQALYKGIEKNGAFKKRKFLRRQKNIAAVAVTAVATFHRDQTIAKKSLCTI